MHRHRSTRLPGIASAPFHARPLTAHGPDQYVPGHASKLPKIPCQDGRCRLLPRPPRRPRPRRLRRRPTTAHVPAQPAYKRVGYFTQWGIYGRDFQVKDLDTSGQAAKLTHINYAFGNVSSDGTCFTGNVPGEADAWADYVRPLDAAGSVDGVADTAEQPLAGNFNQLRELKAKHPGLKVLISLGGWSWSTHFSDAARTPASRKALRRPPASTSYIKGNLPVDGARGGAGAAAGLFDGVDLDWEWPGSAGDTGTVFRPEDKQNFTALVREFRTQLDAYGRARCTASASTTS